MTVSQIVPDWNVPQGVENVHTLYSVSGKPESNDQDNNIYIYLKHLRYYKVLGNFEKWVDSYSLQFLYIWMPLWMY